MSEHTHIRPPTPQTLVHRLPDKPEISSDRRNTKPSKFIILIAASNAVAGKVQIAQSVSRALECPLYQGDSLHETAARAARVGGGGGGSGASSSDFNVNETRYQRMWLSKLTRTGLLFPEESRAAGAGFSGFGGDSVSRGMTTTSNRRASTASSEDSFSSSMDESSSSVSTRATSVTSLERGATNLYIAKPDVTSLPNISDKQPANPALMVLTHSDLEVWQRKCIRNAVGEYGIGVIFVPLDEDAEPPVLRPLDPTTMTSFGSLDKATRATNWEDEVALTVDADGTVEDLAEEIVSGVRELMSS